MGTLKKSFKTNWRQFFYGSVLLLIRNRKAQATDSAENFDNVITPEIYHQ